VIVLDTSLAMAWCYEDEATAFTTAMLQRVADEGAVVPVIWPIEVANAMLVGERRGRLTSSQAARFVHTLAAQPIEVDDEAWLALIHPIMGLARQENLSAYDASYLELALRRGLPLATQDARLRDAATRVGVPLVTHGP
jgi:predicted nucleic acid-binding protein